MARIARCEVAFPYAWAAMAFLGKLLKYCRAKPGQVLFWAGTTEGLTLMLHTYVEEKRARVRQMWLRTGLDRLTRT